MTSKAIVHDELKPAGTFPDLKHLQGQARTPTSRSISICGAATPTKALPSADQRVRAHASAPSRCCTCRSSRSSRSPSATESALTIHTASQSPSFVRIEIARLLGWPENRVRVSVPFLGGGFGAKLYIKLEALVAVLSLLVRAAGEDLADMEEQFYTITKHASTFRIKSGVTRTAGSSRANARCGGTAAPMPTSARASRRSPGFTAPGPYDIEQRRDRFLRALHQPAAGRRAARLRHPAAGLGLREPHRHDGARARHRPGRVPAQEPAARRPPAGDRHGRCRTRRIEAVLDRIAARMDWGKPVRPRQRHA